MGSSLPNVATQQPRPNLKQSVHTKVGLNSIYSVIINTIVNMYAMSCEAGFDSKHIAYIS